MEDTPAAPAEPPPSAATPPSLENDAAATRARCRARYLKGNEELEGSTHSHRIWKTYDSDEGVEVALHELFLSRWNASSVPSALSSSSSTEALKRLQRDADAHHLIRLLDVWRDEVAAEEGGGECGLTLCYVTPIVTAGTLQGYISRIDDVRVRVVRKWCRQLLTGLCHLHEALGKAHGDLRLANIYINGETGNVLLNNFNLLPEEGGGVSGGGGETHADALQRARFAPPGGFTDPHATANDVWAFGLCVLEMLTRRAPYSRFGGSEEGAAPLAALPREKAGGALPEELALLEERIAVAVGKEGEARERAAAAILQLPALEAAVAAHASAAQAGATADAAELREARVALERAGNTAAALAQAVKDASDRCADLHAMKKLTLRCLSTDPGARPTVRELMEAEVLRERDGEREKPPAAPAGGDAGAGGAGGGGGGSNISAAAAAAAVAAAATVAAATAPPPPPLPPPLLPPPPAAPAEERPPPEEAPKGSIITSITTAPASGIAATAAAGAAPTSFITSIRTRPGGAGGGGGGRGARGAPAVGVATAAFHPTSGRVDAPHRLDFSKPPLTAPAAAAAARRPSRLPLGVEPPPLLGLSLRQLTYHRSEVWVVLYLYHPTPPVAGAAGAGAAAPAALFAPPLPPTTPAAAPGASVVVRHIMFPIPRLDPPAAVVQRLAMDLIAQYIVALGDQALVTRLLEAALAPAFAPTSYAVLTAEALDALANGGGAVEGEGHGGGAPRAARKKRRSGTATGGAGKKKEEEEVAGAREAGAARARSNTASSSVAARSVDGSRLGGDTTEGGEDGYDEEEEEEEEEEVEGVVGEGGDGLDDVGAVEDGEEEDGGGELRVDGGASDEEGDEGGYVEEEIGLEGGGGGGEWGGDSVGVAPTPSNGALASPRREDAHAREEEDAGKRPRSHTSGGASTKSDGAL